ncbi:protein of unknown function [Streptomyces murinus]
MTVRAEGMVSLHAYSLWQSRQLVQALCQLTSLGFSFSIYGVLYACCGAAADSCGGSGHDTVWTYVA